MIVPSLRGRLCPLTPNASTRRRPARHVAAGAALTLLLACANVIDTARAASLQVSPVIVSLPPAQPATTLTLSNAGTRPIHGQLRLYAWSQHNGRDVLSATQHIIASPPILRLEPGERQLVRLVRVAQTPPHEEETYRLLVDELPAPGEAPADGVTIRLRYSLPVFVQMDATHRPALRFVMHAPQGRLEVHNTGARHAQLGATRITDASGRTVILARGLLGYVLAGRSRAFAVRLPAGAPFQPPYRIESRVDTVHRRYVADLPGDGPPAP